MIFKPTGTSDLLIKAVSPYIEKGKLLDLGCGCGIVGKSLMKEGIQWYASDISGEAIFSINPEGCHCFVRQGNLFDCWEGHKFDYIIDDVSGISSELAKISPWFNGVPCDSGIDGTKLVCKVIQQAPEYLTRGGKLFFPIVSLSNKLRIVQTAIENFGDVKCIATEHFPLPKEMYKHLDLMKDLRLRGYIDYKSAFGGIIFWTDIYLAQS